MRPKDVLRAVPSVNGGAMLIAPISGGNVILLGASCSTNGVVGNYVDALVIVPDVGVKDVVAIHYSVFIGSSKNGHRADYYFFIGVDGGNNKPVNLEDHWIPSADRLAVISDGRVQVEIEGKRYIGAEYLRDAYNPSGFYVDPNLLCKYLVGKATAEEVQAAAKEFRKDEPFLAQKEQKELQAEVERLNTALAAECEERKKAVREAHLMGQKHGDLSDAYYELVQVFNKLADLAHWFCEETRGQWFKSDVLKRTLRMYAAFLKDRANVLTEK